MHMQLQLEFAHNILCTVKVYKEQDFTYIVPQYSEYE